MRSLRNNTGTRSLRGPTPLQSFQPGHRLILCQRHLLERLHKLQQLHFLIFTQLRSVFVAGVAVAEFRSIKLGDITQVHRS
jgi:hypothetical protein